ncbi:hypothetical protein QUB47_34570 [Microcoleus sp. AT9_B5]
MNSERLKDFRQAAYNLLVKAKDATFELMDAVMTTPNASSLAEFSPYIPHFLTHIPQMWVEFFYQL